jgi:hypothetical protein
MSQPSVRALVPLAIPLLLGLNCPNTGGPPAGGEAGGEAGAADGAEGGAEAGAEGGAGVDARGGAGDPDSWTGEFVVYLSPAMGPAFAAPRAARAACSALTTAGGLAGEPLFAELRDAPGDGSELDRFCLLQPLERGIGGPPRLRLGAQRAQVLDALRGASGADPGGWAGLLRSGGLSGLVDAAFTSVVALQGPAGAAPVVSDRQVALTSTELGLMDPAAVLKAAGDHPARVVVLDTHPTGALSPAPAGEDHGAKVAGLIQGLVCPSGGACPVQVRSERALPYVVGPMGRVRMATPDAAGAFGTTATVARGVQRAAEGSLDRPAVLNLSLGFNPLSIAWGAQDPGAGPASPVASDRLLDYGALPAGPKAVLASLIFARCRGHLPIAAAGNRSIGGLPNASQGQEDGRSGALLPARWMDVPQGGDTPGCAAFIGGRPDGWPNGAPLLIAAGGLGRGGLRFDRGRPQGLGPVVALADGVSMEVRPSVGAPAQVVELDGTSASAALTSGALALMWSLQGGGGVSADAARAALVATLPATALDADLGGGGKAVRVDLCAVLQRFTPSLSCPPPVPDAPRGTLAPALGEGQPGADCSGRGGNVSAAPLCAEPSAPTPDLRFEVIPQPPLGCPPCDLELIPGVGTNPDRLRLVLGATSGAVALLAPWRGPAWSGDLRDVKEAVLEVRHGIEVSPFVTTYRLTRDQLGDGGAPLGVEAVLLQAGGGMNLATVRSATLILQAEEKASPTSNPTPVSYVVGVPIAP